MKKLKLDNGYGEKKSIFVDQSCCLTEVVKDFQRRGWEGGTSSLPISELIKLLKVNYRKSSPRSRMQKDLQSK